MTLISMINVSMNNVQSCWCVWSRLCDCTSRSVLGGCRSTAILLFPHTGSLFIYECFVCVQYQCSAVMHSKADDLFVLTWRFTPTTLSNRWLLIADRIIIFCCCLDSNNGGATSSSVSLFDSASSGGFGASFSGSSAGSSSVTGSGAQFDGLDRWNSYENFNDLSASYDSLRAIEGPARGRLELLEVSIDVLQGSSSA